TQHWQRHAAANWVAYMEGNLAEEADRRAATRPNAEQRTHLHRSSGGVRPSFDLAERVAHFEIPAPARYGDHKDFVEEFQAQVRAGQAHRMQSGSIEPLACERAHRVRRFRRPL